MLRQKSLGGGNARCLLQVDPKSRMKNNQEMVLLKLNGFLTPVPAGSLKREKVILNDRVSGLKKDLHRSTQQLWSAEKEKKKILTELKRLKTDKENLEELKSQFLETMKNYVKLVTLWKGQTK